MANPAPTIPDLLRDWLPPRRWYPVKNSSVESGTSGESNGAGLYRVGGFRLTPPADAKNSGVGSLEVHLVSVRTSPSTEREGTEPEGTVTVLQIPLRCRTEALAGAETSLIGITQHPELGECWVYDGVYDPVFLAAWLDLLHLQSTTEDGALSSYSSAQFRSVHELGKTTRIRVISSEQSNSSVVINNRVLPLILKFFRVLNSGINPDIEVGQALTEAGCLDTPALHGWVQGSWDSAPRTGQRVVGSLCVLHELVPKAQDGWDLAVASAKASSNSPGKPAFTVEAEQLGLVTARLHATMRSALGRTSLHAQARGEFLAELEARIRWAWSQAGPAVGPFQHLVGKVLDGLVNVEGPLELQRIHGDLHLGQVIRTLADGQPAKWFVLDFEGEPLRAVAERSRPDVPLRDVVGLLRSIDYASATANGEPENSAWAEQTSAAFIRGYESLDADGNRISTTSPLFLALCLDKALYEVVYELRNRPDWLQVPVAAVRRLLSSLETDEGETAMNSANAAEPHQPISVSEELLRRVSAGNYHAPHEVLGVHLDEQGWVTIRTLRDLVQAVAVVTSSGTVEMQHEYDGIWVAVLQPEQPGHAPDYRISASYADGNVETFDDPYRFLPTLGDVDLHLIGEGRHEELWAALGSHRRSYPSQLGAVNGVSFAVWAPNAQAVRVKADFNNWDGRGYAMRSLGSSGVWEIFIPDAKPGNSYKFEILSRAGTWQDKADPMAFGTEVPPLTASKVVESNYKFTDTEWMAQRSNVDPHNSPMSVYEVHLGSWRPGLSYLELSRELVEYAQWMGFTHVEFMPVAEHPFGGSWGYQVTSYFAPTSRFGDPKEFKHLVDALHGAGIGVIVDWVPAHFPKDEWALAKFDGEPLYEHSDPQLGEHPDWGTLIFDFGRSEVRNFLTANALFWFEEFHVDGLRVDAVASMLYLDYSREAGEWKPNRLGGRENLEAISFLQEVNATAYKRSGGVVMIAEESTAFPGVTAPTDQNGLGFGLKWNMGWMHDSLAYIAEDPINRKWHHGTATFSLVYAFTENFLLPISHDEVVHGKGSMLRKMPGDRWQQLANLWAFLAWQWAHPGKQLIFMGTEFGQEAEWSEQHGLDWWLADMAPQRGVQLLVRQLNEVYRLAPARWQQDNSHSGFEWINATDADRNVISFIRRDLQGNPLVCVVNFSGAPHHDYRLGLPSAGQWRELLNTDAEEYGGSGVGRVEPAAIGHAVLSSEFGPGRITPGHTSVSDSKTTFR